jgi:hypothetical protein
LSARPGSRSRRWPGIGVNEGTLANRVMLDRRRRDTGNGALGEDERAGLARLRWEYAALRMRFPMETASFPDAGRLWVEPALELAARLHAARTASAAAASLMRLGLPIAASASGRSATIPATLMVWARWPAGFAHLDQVRQLARQLTASTRGSTS